MEKFSMFVNQMDAIVWSMVLVVLCLGVGLYLSLRLKFPQIRLVKEMVKLLTSKEESESGITPFQAFATTVGARVGMGNIAGVASAIFYGGPGSVFWMLNRHLPRHTKSRVLTENSPAARHIT